MAKDELTKGERIIIRNQRYIMLALANLCQNSNGTMSGYHGGKLSSRVKEMERAFDWIAAPSERLSQD